MARALERCFKTTSSIQNSTSPPQTAAPPFVEAKLEVSPCSPSKQTTYAKTKRPAPQPK
jgi:hypothetical protein